MVDGVLYVMGGHYPYQTALKTVWAYDPAQGFSARRKMPRTRAAGGYGVIDGKIHLAGGTDTEPVVNPNPVHYKTLDVFDPQGGMTPQILSATLETTNRLRLVWQAEAGFKYGVESSPDVVTNRWTRALPTGSTVTATNALVEASCPVAPGEPSQFLRVLEAN